MLELEATNRHGDSKAYIAEVQQADLFTIAGYSEAELDYMLGSYCPTMLYPFARETISQLTGNGGFPPLTMPPINFDTVHAQQGTTENRRAIAPVTTRIIYE